MTENKCYSTLIDAEELALRDFLATDRTALANERTLLAYIRTAISVVAAGIGFIKLFEIPIIQYMGYLFLPLGIFILIFGFYRYLKIEKKLFKIKYK